jgi:alanyl-tRNA synthetase
VLATTERLYWQDPYCREFEAHLIRRTEVDARPAVVLDRTCFYPTSGGQPHDTGVLSGVPVLEVIDTEEDILHVLAAPLDGAIMRGAIDWARRFDHMQQHTGQHLLSRAVEQLLGANTVSFHLGVASSTIDINRESLDAAEAAMVEELANRVVWENRTVSVCEVSAQEAENLDLRKAVEAIDRVRVVTVDGFDRCACGGTHVRATGEVGSVHIRGWGRQRDDIRIEFLCGRRAVDDYRLRDAVLQQSASTLSVGVGELGEAIERLRMAEAEARHEAEGLRRRVLELDVPRLAAEAKEVAGLHLICQVLKDYDGDGMRAIAQRLIQYPGMIVLLAVGGPSPQICFARSRDVDLDMGQLLRDAAGPFGGRGGGRPHMAQGGGVDGDRLTDVLNAARDMLTSVGSAHKDAADE